MEYIVTFTEGLVSFISPCMLPLLPVYISFIAGGEGKKKKTILHSLFFVLGFTLLFVCLGVFAGTVGKLLDANLRIVEIVCGIIVILFGVVYIAGIEIPFFKSVDGSGIKRGTFVSSMLFGMIYAINLTPCTGPFLGSALMLAASSAGALKGALLLLVYSLGLAVPFLLAALVIGQLSEAIRFVREHYRIINIVCGAFLVIVGILMIFGVFGKYTTLFS
jgi:cytochrome c-type biogenesis protein